MSAESDRNLMALDEGLTSVSLLGLVRRRYFSGVSLVSLLVSYQQSCRAGRAMFPALNRTKALLKCPFCWHVAPRCLVFGARRFGIITFASKRRRPHIQ